MEKEFKNISELLFSQLNKEEDLILSLSGENSQFIRFNNASVRQTGLVDDAELELKFISNNLHNFMNNLLKLFGIKYMTSNNGAL